AVEDGFDPQDVEPLQLLLGPDDSPAGDDVEEMLHVPQESENHRDRHGEEGHEQEGGPDRHGEVAGQDDGPAERLAVGGVKEGKDEDEDGAAEEEEESPQLHVRLTTGLSPLAPGR